MTDQTPIKYTIKSEARSEITRLTESEWEKAAHRLVILLDHALDKRDRAGDANRVTPQVITQRQKTRKRRYGRPATRDWGEVRTFIAANPNVHVASLARHLDIGESTVRRIRASLGLPLFHPGRNLILRFQDLLAENPEISDAEAAERLEASQSYIRKVRLRLKRSETPIAAPETAISIKGSWE